MTRRDHLIQPSSAETRSQVSASGRPCDRLPERPVRPVSVEEWSTSERVMRRGIRAAYAECASNSRSDIGIRPSTLHCLARLNVHKNAPSMLTGREAMARGVAEVGLRRAEAACQFDRTPKTVIVEQ